MAETHQEKKKKIAIVHDFLLYPGGAESVLRSLMHLYPDAPVFVLLYDENRYKKILGDELSGREIHASFLQRLPAFLKKRHKFLLPLYAPATESLDLREYDLVISSSGAWSKGLVTRLYTDHIAYIHSPMRYIWDENERYMQRAVKRGRFFARQLLSYIRVWDYQAAQRPDRLIANSLYTADRIKKYYRREADVVYPAVSVPRDIAQYRDLRTMQGAGDYFVIIARLVNYKNIHIAIDVCNKLSLPLQIIGEGPYRKTLEKRAGKTITFLGWCTEEEKWRILAGARAFLFPATEDFGIVCVESLLAGVPVIMLDKGGAREIIQKNIHGIHFKEPTEEVLADSIRRFMEKEAVFDRQVLYDRGEYFSQKRFATELQKNITNVDVR